MQSEIVQFRPRPVFMRFAPVEERVLPAGITIQYDPESQEAVVPLEAGGYSTACYQTTNGTEPKNEADTMMDDN